MKKFKQFIDEHRKIDALFVYDVDDTLVHPTAKIHHKDEHGKIVKTMNSHEYAKSTHKKLPKGHSYDFSEFRSSEKFEKESKPIKPMISHVRLTSASKKNKVIFNTARQNLDDKKKFTSTFTRHGINMKKIHVLRAGNIRSDESGPKKKARITSGYIKTHKPKEVHMYDDDKGNLNEFLKLRHKHPNVKFYAHHVQHDGKLVPHEEEK